MRETLIVSRINTIIMGTNKHSEEDLKIVGNIFGTIKPSLHLDKKGFKIILRLFQKSQRSCDLEW